ncbi:MAG: ABC transporter permease [Bacteroidota bacterium]|nr:ABC transporter permease [Bacteroidota bacterium]
MEVNIPKTSAVFSSLLRADLTTQWRNRRAVVLILFVPVIILISWKDVIDKIGGAFALSACITIGLMAIGLMGYSNSIARDRDKGVFQRLRVAPVAAWSIMASRLIVQMMMIMLVTVIVFFTGFYVDHISLSPVGYALTFLTAIIGGAVYLGIGQVIVGLIKNPETVNSTTRLVYFVFIMVGMFGEFGILGSQVKKLAVWSPYGTVKHVLAAGMEPAKWNGDTSIALLVTIGYALVFSVIGIKKFKWNTK